MRRTVAEAVNRRQVTVLLDLVKPVADTEDAVGEVLQITVRLPNRIMVAVHRPVIHPNLDSAQVHIHQIKDLDQFKDTEIQVNQVAVSRVVADQNQRIRRAIHFHQLLDVHRPLDVHHRPHQDRLVMAHQIRQDVPNRVDVVDHRQHTHRKVPVHPRIKPVHRQVKVVTERRLNLATHPNRRPAVQANQDIRQAAVQQATDQTSTRDVPQAVVQVHLHRHRQAKVAMERPVNLDRRQATHRNRQHPSHILLAVQAKQDIRLVVVQEVMDQVVAKDVHLEEVVAVFHLRHSALLYRIGRLIPVTHRADMVLNRQVVVDPQVGHY